MKKPIFLIIYFCLSLSSTSLHFYRVLFRLIIIVPTIFLMQFLAIFQQTWIGFIRFGVHIFSLMVNVFYAFDIELIIFLFINRKLYGCLQQQLNNTMKHAFPMYKYFFTFILKCNWKYNNFSFQNSSSSTFYRLFLYFAV